MKSAFGIANHFKTTRIKISKTVPPNVRLKCLLISTLTQIYKIVFRKNKMKNQIELIIKNIVYFSDKIKALWLKIKSLKRHFVSTKRG